MAAANLPEFVATDREVYIALAVALASDPARRAHERARLRTHLANSALLDGRRMATDFADALHAIWRMPRS
jgi:protein O-GlcNAc transferase